MVQINVRCMHCQSQKVVKMGFQTNVTPRCKCKRCGKTFQTEYLNNGAKIETKFMIIKMSVNGSGIRDISRVLGISKDTVISVLKKLKILLST